MLFSDKPADAIDKLKEDHDKVEELIDRMKDAAPAEAQKIGVRMCNLIKIHMILEEEFLYPALRRAGGDEDKLTEGLVEHDSGKVLINDVLDGRTSADLAAAKLQVLGEQMVHHHKEEEESGGIFDQARESDIDLVKMRDDMLGRERELQTELREDDGLPKAETNFVRTSATPA